MDPGAAALILIGLMISGTTLAGTTVQGLIAPNFAVSVGFEVENYSKWIMKRPKVRHRKIPFYCLNLSRLPQHSYKRATVNLMAKGRTGVALGSLARMRDTPSEGGDESRDDRKEGHGKRWDQ